MITTTMLKMNNPINKNTLVVGPWRHGGWARMDGDYLGEIDFGQKTSIYYRENIEFPFFNFYLKIRMTTELKR